ncbi:MAG TPA: hypothetical protein VFQ45_21170 [Longimicrobium sp.]|nr:hypothetical protein [Longimicrobium sp.]
MTRGRGGLLAAFACAAAVAGCTGAARTALREDPSQVLLDRAIAQAGGAEALERARALAWQGDAAIHDGERTIRIAGTWGVQPPDTAVVATYDVTRGEASTRAMVVAAPRGWIIMPGAQPRPMPDAMLANERDQFYLYEVIRLVPLRDPRVTLTALPPDSAGRPGTRAEQPGRPRVDLYFDPAGRLVRLRTEVADPEGGPAVRQDVWLSGVMEAGGVRWPAELRITQDGAPYFTLSMRNLRVLPRLDDPRLRGP